MDLPAKQAEDSEGSDHDKARISQSFVVLAIGISNAVACERRMGYGSRPFPPEA